jgi:hypothetical protein
MAVPAQGLKLPKPEPIPVPTVRLDMVGDDALHHLTLFEVMCAKRMLCELKFGARFPTAEAVPLPRIRRVQHQRLVWRGLQKREKFGFGCSAPQRNAIRKCAKNCAARIRPFVEDKSATGTRDERTKSLETGGFCGEWSAEICFPKASASDKLRSLG